MKNKLIYEAYILLAATIFWIVITAIIAMILHIRIHWAVVLFGYFGLLYVVDLAVAYSNTYGLLAMFLLASFVGFIILGPLFDLFDLKHFSGYLAVTDMFGSISVIFVLLSIYALKANNNFSYLIGVLITGLWLMLKVLVLYFVFRLETLYVLFLTIPAILISTYILYVTKQLINSGESNYILLVLDFYTLNIR